jgi:hypothetical protein
MNKFLLIALLSMSVCIKLCLFIAIIYYSSNNIIIPNYLLNILYNVSHKSIYYYSKLQLGFIKTKNNITIYAKSVPVLNNLLTYMNTDNTIYTYTNVNNNLTICSKYYREKNMFHKIIINFTPDNEEKKNIETSNIEEADYKFIMTEITIGDKKFVIHFTTDKYNYLMVTNGFDSEFIGYFLKTHYSEMIKDLEIEKYRIKIIDHNVNIIEFDNTQLLYIDKNDYNILTDNK